jgi:hypothetical protein
MATIGYFEGMDSLVLTRLAAKGIGTLPVSNGFDAHGKLVSHLSAQDGVSLIVGYLHKVLPTTGFPGTARQMLSTWTGKEIPVLLIVERAFHDAARERLGDAQARVQLVDPDDIYKAIMAMLS